jgi:hypothetical protein
MSRGIPKLKEELFKANTLKFQLHARRRRCWMARVSLELQQPLLQLYLQVGSCATTLIAIGEKKG